MAARSIATENEFYKGTDWEGSSGPLIMRQFAVADLWPVGLDSESDGSGDKDVLEDGLHPVVAIGNRSYITRGVPFLTGVVVTVNNAAQLAQVNIAHGFVTKAFVSNITAYAMGSPSSYASTLYVGMPVYVDDSVALPAGVTLSLSPLNDLDAPNPLAGWIFPGQSDYDDDAVGGAGNATFPLEVSTEAPTNTLLNVLLSGFDPGQYVAPAEGPEN